VHIYYVPTECIQTAQVFRESYGDNTYEVCATESSVQDFVIFLPSSLEALHMQRQQAAILFMRKAIVILPVLLTCQLRTVSSLSLMP